MQNEAILLMRIVAPFSGVSAPAGEGVGERRKIMFSIVSSLLETSPVTREDVSALFRGA